MLDRVVSLHPSVLFVIRFYAEQPPGYDGDSVVMLNLNDSDPTVLNNASNAASLEMNSLTEEWVSRASTGLSTMLTYLDREYENPALVV